MKKIIELDKGKIGERIHQIRKESNMTMEKFGSIIGGINKATVSYWEKGKSLPSERYLKLIAQTFDIDYKWLIYGDLEDYVKAVLASLNVDVNEYISEIDYLINVLKVKNVKQGDYNEVINHAKTIIPPLYEDNIDEMKTNDMSEKDKIDFEILKDKHFHDVYVHSLNDLLLKDEKAHEHDQIFMFLIDLLSRMNQSTKEELKEVVQEMNWLLSNNIFRLEKKYQSKEAVFGGIVGGAYEEQKERSYEEIEQDAEKIIENITEMLRHIWKENYHEFQKRDFKSIF